MNTRAGIGTLIVAVLLTSNWGCYYDEFLQEQTASRNLRGEKERLQNDLMEERAMKETLSARIDGLEQDNDTKDALIESLTQERDSIRAALEKAENLAARVIDRPPDKPIVVRLPAELDRALKDFAARHPDVAAYDTERGAVRWKADLLFALGSDVVRDSAKAALKGFADVMRSPAAEKFDVIIVGHTDNVPIVKPGTKQKHPTNWHLSCHRAIAVMFELKRDGVKFSRMGVMGYGEERPIVPNSTDENRAKNRRVEIFIVATSALGGIS